MGKKMNTEFDDAEFRQAVLERVAEKIAERIAGSVPAKAPEKPPIKMGEDRNADVDWTRVKHKCPICRETKFVVPDFGVRVVRGTTMKQSYCRVCRSKMNYHNKPRKAKSYNRTATGSRKESP